MQANSFNYYQLIDQSLADSSLRAQVPEGKFIGAFLQQSITKIEPLGVAPSNDLFTFILFFFITGLAVIWFFIPERLAMVFKISTKKTFSRSGEISNKAPGILISLFFFLNFLLNMSIFIFLLLKYIDNTLFSGTDTRLIILYIMAGISAFYVFRLTYIKISGKIFKTEENASQQLTLYINTDNAVGILLVPVLLIVLYSDFDFLIFSGILIALIFQIIKWIKTFVIGISIQGFTVLHLILYLCTLEIIPILIVIKLVEKGGL